MSANLVALCPTMIGMLRRSHAQAADLFLDNVEKEDVTTALKELRDDVEHEEHLLTMTQVRYTYTNHDDAVWAAGLLIVISQAKVVSPDIAKRLLQSFAENKDALSNPEESGAVLGPILDDMPRLSFQVLGELCALIRDTASKPSDIAQQVSSRVLGVNDPNAGTLLSLLVQNAEPLFGRVAAVRTRVLFESDM